MSITAASCTALALLETYRLPMSVHSIYGSSLNLRCGEHLIHVSDRYLGGVASLCVTTDDLKALRGRKLWVWKAETLVGAGGHPAVRMDEAADRYPTSPPPPPRLSTATPDRLAGARARTGRNSWFDTGVGLSLGLPRLGQAISALVGHEPDAAERMMGIVGLGAGLTPSADDALVGALCLLSAEDALPGGLLDQMVRWLRGAGATVTTDVSLSYLRLAAGGAFSSPITRVVRCLAETSSQVDLDDSVDALSRLGAASGMDTALGIQLACDFQTRSASHPIRS
jgi:hypothetical protein